MCRTCFLVAYEDYLRAEILTEGVISGLIMRYPPNRYGILRSDLRLMAQSGVRWRRSSRRLVPLPVLSLSCSYVYPDFSFTRKNK